MFILSAIARLTADYRLRRRRLATSLQLYGLPREIQKDIGWPDPVDERRQPRRNRR